MNVKDTIENTVEITMKTYGAQPVVMDRGEGCYAFDTDGNKYLDFAAGIAVASLGHAHPKMLAVINEQAGKMMACQASYVTEPKLAAAKLLIDNGCFDEVYFSNSGTESVEAALKMARKWAYDNKGPQATEIISFRNSFHGRTYGAASVTEKRLSQPFYDPYLPDVHFADFNDLASVEALVSDKTAAIIVEPVQGEGGLNPADPWFLRGLRDLCDAQQIVLIFDEVQCGSGRLGSFYAYQSFECCGECVDDSGPVNPANAAPIEPDIACLAKGMGGGFPVGAMVAKQAFADAFVPGTHGTTYGGNPLACAVAACVLGEIATPELMANVNAMGVRLTAGLQRIQAEGNKISRVAGMGTMIGFAPTTPVKDTLETLRKNGLMATMSGADLIRLTPPLIAGEAEIDEALGIIEATLKGEF